MLRAGRPTPWRKHVPRTPWRRRRATDSPRPAGRRWAGRLRRSGSLARQMLLVGRVGRRRGDGTVTRATSVLLPAEPDAFDTSSTRRPRLRMRRREGATLDATTLAPVSPAVPVRDLPPVRRHVAEEPQALSIPLLPGERTLARRMRFLLVQACTVGSLALGISAI